MPIVHFNQSRVKQFRRCQKQYSYRYDYAKFYGGTARQEMIPQKRRLPLYRGSWMHALQQALHYQWADAVPFDMTFGEGKQSILIKDIETWHDVQDALVQQYDQLFDEEKEDLGDLPDETERLFKAYLRFWKEDQDKYSVAELPGGKPAIEFIVQSPLEKFGLKDAGFKGKIDLLVEDEEYGGLWIWDAKWVKKIPPPDERMMSPQALLYPWALRETHDLDVRGFVFNYGRTKAPVYPRILKNGTLSTAQRMDTDLHTYLTAIKERHGIRYKKFLPYYKPKLRDLKGREGLWFDRARIPVEHARQLSAVREYIATVRDIQGREKRRDYIPRSYFYNCKFGCDYHDLCAAEFQGLEIEPLVKQSMMFSEERYTREEDLLHA